jgi:hypothetical protein
MKNRLRPDCEKKIKPFYVSVAALLAATPFFVLVRLVLSLGASSVSVATMASRLPTVLL